MLLLAFSGPLITTPDMNGDEPSKQPSGWVEPNNPKEKENLRKIPKDAEYEIVLVADLIAFNTPDSVSIQYTLRNVGMTKLFVPDIVWEWSLVWDGKACKRNPQYTRPWNGPAELIPKGSYRSILSLSNYLVPAKLLTPGRHTIALKHASTQSNTQTIFIEKGSADQKTAKSEKATNERTPTSAADMPWGEPFEGLYVRIRADKKRWATNETPTFNVDVSNQGHREFYTFRSQEPGRLEVDGVWYEWTGGIDLKASPIPPGREYQDIKVTLGLDWKATQEWRDKTQPRPPQIPVKLLPGKHTIRFAPQIREIGVEPKPRNTYVPSNPIEIET